MKNRVLVKSVLASSIAEEVGVLAGDVILTINDHEIKDIFDYRFQISNEVIYLLIQKPTGEEWEIEIEKEEYEDLGIEFFDELIDGARSCNNHCIFCFVDQLPKGMRQTLYFKDDDTRLSFLSGNYVTLTNISHQDIKRIVKYKMSPVNVSVHTTNPDLRKRMLGNRFGGDIMDKIKDLVHGGITVNCQIVLVRDVNDGVELYSSVLELASLYPGIQSISIVPVGLTRFRAGLETIVPFDLETSLKVIDSISKLQQQFFEKLGSRVVYLSDEFYILAGVGIPGYDSYEEFPQIENGVGLIASLQAEFYEALSAIGPKDYKEDARCVSIVTGTLAYPFIKRMADSLTEMFSHITVNVFCIKNDFFGHNVTVTGLLTAQDVILQLAEKALGDELMICRCMLRADDVVFLDDLTVADVAERLNIKVTIVENSGHDLVHKIMKR